MIFWWPFSLLHGLFILPISPTSARGFMIKSEKCSISEKCPVGSVTNAALWLRTQRPKTIDALSSSASCPAQLERRGSVHWRKLQRACRTGCYAVSSTVNSSCRYRAFVLKTIGHRSKNTHGDPAGQYSSVPMLSLWFINTASANRLKFTPFSTERPKQLVSAEGIVDIKKS